MLTKPNIQSVEGAKCWLLTRKRPPGPTSTPTVNRIIIVIDARGKDVSLQGSREFVAVSAGNCRGHQLAEIAGMNGESPGPAATGMELGL